MLSTLPYCLAHRKKDIISEVVIRYDIVAIKKYTYVYLFSK